METTRDEYYIIDILDEILGTKASRQYKFDFLLGCVSPKTGRQTKLPVDAYYLEHKLVVEFHEKQHDPDKKIGKKLTICGIPRYEQRARYDQIRRDVLPQHNITLLELKYSDFSYNKKRKLLREGEKDREIIKTRLRNIGVQLFAERNFNK